MTADDVPTFLEGVTPAKRRRDAEVLVELMQRVTGEPPRMWGSSIVGFGRYRYEYESGRSGDGPAASFAPRKAATVVYLADGTGDYADELGRLGPHTTGVGCLYLKDLSAVDLDVLEQIVRASYGTATGASGTE